MQPSKGAGHQPREINYLRLPAHQLCLNQLKLTLSTGWFYLLGSGEGLGLLGCWGLFFAASSGDGNHLTGQEDLSHHPAPGSASPISQENLAPLLPSASISDSRGVGGCLARHCALLQFQHGFPGQLLMLLSWNMGNILQGSEFNAKIFLFASL